jgi:TPR repeat protein
LPLDDEGAEILNYAKSGDLHAIRNLGCAFIWGENGFPKDESRARHWYIVAARHGHYQAMWDVATMLLNGEGGPKDIEKGIQFLSRVSNKNRFTVYVWNKCIRIFNKYLQRNCT